MFESETEAISGAEMVKTSRIGTITSLWEFYFLFLHRSFQHEQSFLVTGFLSSTMARPSIFFVVMNVEPVTTYQLYSRYSCH